MKAFLCILSAASVAILATAGFSQTVLMPQTADGTTPSQLAVPTSAIREIRTKRVITGNILANVFGNVTVTWDTPFPDTNYTIAYAIQTSGAGLLGVDSIISQTTSGCVIAVKNLSLLSPNSGTLHVTAIRD